MRRLTWWRLRRRLAEMQVVVLDVDGVLTDGGLWHGPEGELIKRFDVRDGLGIRLLQHAGLEVAFLSGGRGGATEVRAQQLGVTAQQIVFVGDDVNDLALQGAVGLLVATADAAAPLRRRADAVLRRNGGHGAVRELAERLLQARGLWAQLSREGWRDRND